MNPASNSVTTAEIEALFEDAPIHAEPPEPPAMFALKQNLITRMRVESRKGKAKRAGIKRMIKPENAEAFRDYIPEPGDTVHAVVRGDFVFADIIPVFLGQATADLVAIATLGMSQANARMLKDLADNGRIKRLKVLVSNYFAAVDKTTVFPEIHAILGDALTVHRNHAKIILIDAPPNAYVLAGSANLRSSDNIEQFSAWNDPELLQFHCAWMNELENSYKEET